MKPGYLARYLFLDSYQQRETHVSPLKEQRWPFSCPLRIRDYDLDRAEKQWSFGTNIIERPLVKMSSDLISVLGHGSYFLTHIDNEKLICALERATLIFLLSIKNPRLWSRPPRETVKLWYHRKKFCSKWVPIEFWSFATVFIFWLISTTRSSYALLIARRLPFLFNQKFETMPLPFRKKNETLIRTSSKSYLFKTRNDLVSLTRTVRISWLISTTICPFLFFKERRWPSSCPLRTQNCDFNSSQCNRIYYHVFKLPFITWINRHLADCRQVELFLQLPLSFIEG